MKLDLVESPSDVLWKADIEPLLIRDRRWKLISVLIFRGVTRKFRTTIEPLCTAEPVNPNFGRPER